MDITKNWKHSTDTLLTPLQLVDFLASTFCFANKKIIAVKIASCIFERMVIFETEDDGFPPSLVWYDIYINYLYLEFPNGLPKLIEENLW